MIAFKEGSTQGTRCDRCDWSVVTTNMPCIQLDRCRYEVRCRGDYRNQDQVKAVSEVTGQNYLISRLTLQQGDALVFSGQAQEALQAKIFLCQRVLFVTLPLIFLNMNRNLAIRAVFSEAGYESATAGLDD
ncbi:hypothetical protein [Pseudomonas koreensis]|uniref:hypothetical protein n=1 Tax=Pseudomonas koreensis TaxID=198620 RepID=UPI00381DC688